MTEIEKTKDIFKVEIDNEVAYSESLIQYKDDCKNLLGNIAKILLSFSFFLFGALAINLFTVDSYERYFDPVSMTTFSSMI